MSEPQTTIEHDPERRQIRICVQGEHYDRLEAVANALNSLEWITDKHTPESVFYEFVWHWDLQTLGHPYNLTEEICNAIETGEDIHDHRQEAQREAELRQAFISAGLMPQ